MRTGAARFSDKAIGSVSSESNGFFPDKPANYSFNYQQLDIFFLWIRRKSWPFIKTCAPGFTAHMKIDFLSREVKDFTQWENGSNR